MTISLEQEKINIKIFNIDVTNYFVIMNFQEQSKSPIEQFFVDYDNSIDYSFMFTQVQIYDIQSETSQYYHDKSVKTQYAQIDLDFFSDKNILLKSYGQISYAKDHLILQILLLKNNQDDQNLTVREFFLMDFNCHNIIYAENKIVLQFFKFSHQEIKVLQEIEMNKEKDSIQIDYVIMNSKKVNQISSYVIQQFNNIKLMPFYVDPEVQNYDDKFRYSLMEDRINTDGDYQQIYLHKYESYFEFIPTVITIDFEDYINQLYVYFVSNIQQKIFFVSQEIKVEQGLNVMIGFQTNFYNYVEKEYYLRDSKLKFHFLDDNKSEYQTIQLSQFFNKKQQEQNITHQLNFFAKKEECLYDDTAQTSQLRFDIDLTHQQIQFDFYDDKVECLKKDIILTSKVHQLFIIHQDRVVHYSYFRLNYIHDQILFYEIWIKKFHFSYCKIHMKKQQIFVNLYEEINNYSLFFGKDGSKQLVLSNSEEVINLQDLSISSMYQEDLLQRNFYLNINQQDIDVETMRKNLNIFPTNLGLYLKLTGFNYSSFYNTEQEYDCQHFNEVSQYYDYSKLLQGNIRNARIFVMKKVGNKLIINLIFNTLFDLGYYYIYNEAGKVYIEFGIKQSRQVRQRQLIKFQLSKPLQRKLLLNDYERINLQQILPNKIEYIKDSKIISNTKRILVVFEIQKTKFMRLVNINNAYPVYIHSLNDVDDFQEIESEESDFNSLEQSDSAFEEDSVKKLDMYFYGEKFVQEQFYNKIQMDTIGIKKTTYKPLQIQENNYFYFKKEKGNEEFQNFSLLGIEQIGNQYCSYSKYELIECYKIQDFEDQFFLDQETNLLIFQLPIGDDILLPMVLKLKDRQIFYLGLRILDNVLYVHHEDEFQLLTHVTKSCKVRIDSSMQYLDINLTFLNNFLPNKFDTPIYSTPKLKIIKDLQFKLVDVNIKNFADYFTGIFYTFQDAITDSKKQYKNTLKNVKVQNNQINIEFFVERIDNQFKKREQIRKKIQDKFDRDQKRVRDVKRKKAAKMKSAQSRFIDDVIMNSKAHYLYKFLYKVKRLFGIK